MTSLSESIITPLNAEMKQFFNYYQRKLEKQLPLKVLETINTLNTNPYDDESIEFEEKKPK